ncbi:hypothetical protein DYB26_016251 [Aphanomyces astaci]|uniref:Uncharacterized protein n=1 Tax=Aphanomyces astaci TaxID=112090 RepID=A0A397FBT7_APHAT|nr:hypothetical protein DYB26_016251 [Aphanomyces astaci]RHZ25611.1 hypothetical protein DYB31_009381 [Aphanomyces astaci]
MAARVPLPSEEPAVGQAAEDVDMGFDDAVTVLNAPALHNHLSRMLDNLMIALEADGQEWVLHQEGKLVVGIISKVIKPAPLQLTMTKQLQLQRNKVFKSEEFRYVKWLRQFAIGYQLYGGMDEEKPSKPPAEEPRKENTRPHVEVKKLIDDFHQARRRSVNFVSSTKPANSMECQASIEDVLTLL